MSSATATLASLLRASSIQDHDELLKAANAALKSSKDDLRAQQTRVVALLKLDRFEDALRAVAEGGTKVKQSLVIERAYALYKTGKIEEAEGLVQTATDSSRGLRHLAAQIAYRAEKFEDAAQIYEALPGKGQPGEENDLKINTLATNAQLEWTGLGSSLSDEQRQPAREDLEAFETAYNAACGCVARGDLARASILLKRSRDLCEASDDLSEDEKKAELLPILIQHTYVLHKLSKEDEAVALQKLVSISE
jgi:signal recognition particle subunit SRP72